ncbi:MAG: hypothetical protein IT194_11585 [Microthrixaceae bacterium]|nr:hypothetical protein [Microthrixaceae bacterium]
MPSRWFSISLVLPMAMAAVGATAAVATAGSGLAGAQAGDQVGVGSDGTRVSITGYRAGGQVRTDVRSTSSTGMALVCRELIDSTGGAVDFDLTADWPPLEPGRTAIRRYWISCTLPDGTAVALAGGGLGYLYADQIVDVDAIVRTLAERYANERLGPSVSVGLSPPQGLVGFEQWFWLSGVDPAPVQEIHDVLGHRVELTLEPAGVRWDFGDGTTGDGAAGSTVTHRYRDRSTSAAAPDGAHTVTAEVEVAVRYTLDGTGPFEVQPPLVASAAASLVVREAQAVLHGG